MASKVYVKGLQRLFTGSYGTGNGWDAAGITVKAMLVKNSFAHNQAHEFLNAVDTHRATNLTISDDQALASRSIVTDTANNEVEFRCASFVTFPSVDADSPNTCTGVVLYRDTGNTATSELICFNEFTTPVAPNFSDIRANFDSQGAFKISYVDTDTSLLYASGIIDLGSQGLDWDLAGTTVKALLVKTGYTPNPETHDNLDDIIANRKDGTTDATIANRTTTVAGAVLKVGTSDPTALWNSVGSTGGDVIGVSIYKDTGTASTSDLVCYNKFTSGLATNGSNIQVTWHSDGFFTIDCT